MLQLDPISRPTLAEVCSHEWFNQKMPSAIEVKEEFTSRLAEISKTNIHSGEDMPAETPNPDIFNNVVNWRSTDAEGNENDPCVEREVEEYVKDYINCTHFFSTASLSVLFNVLAVCAHKMSKEYMFSDDTYGVVMTIEHEGSKVIIAVSILKVPDEEKYCVDFRRVDGESVLYSRLYNQILEYFGGFADAHSPGHEE